MEENTHSMNILARHITDQDLFIGYLNIHFIPDSRKGKNLYLSYLMIDKKFDHIRLAGTERHCPSLAEDYRITQRSHSHFTSQKLD